MILNRQSAIRVSVSSLEKFLRRVQRRLRIQSGAVTVCLVNNAQMARWNRAFRKKPGTTDVLSFPANAQERNRTSQRGVRLAAGPSGRKHPFSAAFASPASSAGYLGDIAIAPAVARNNARRFGRTLSDELRILVLHGVLHLMGYDHETDRGEMDRLEQSVRRSLGLA